MLKWSMKDSVWALVISLFLLYPLSLSLSLSLSKNTLAQAIVSSIQERHKGIYVKENESEI